MRFVSIEKKSEAKRRLYHAQQALVNFRVCSFFRDGFSRYFFMKLFYFRYFFQRSVLILLHIYFQHIRFGYLGKNLKRRDYYNIRRISNRAIAGKSFIILVEFSWYFQCPFAQVTRFSTLS
jgi:hypothetical protein